MPDVFDQRDVGEAETHFEIQTHRVAHYFRIRTLPLLVVLLLSLFPFIAPIMDGFDTVSVVTFVPFCLGYLAYGMYLLWFAHKQASALRYWLQHSTLRIDEGILLRKRRSIPLDRITDIVLVQGPVMRLLGIWSLHVQTAGSHQQGPEGILYGVIDADSVRDFIMDSRDRAVGVKPKGSILNGDS